MYPDAYQYVTNCIIKGGIRQGKSRLAEDCARAHIREGMGFCFIDWHGTSYHALMRHLKYSQPPQPVILIDLSKPDFIHPWNPFALPNDTDPSAHVDRLVSLLMKVWSAKDTNETPTLERVASMLFHYAAVSGEPIQHALKLLRLRNAHLRERAIETMDGDMRDDWEDLNDITSLREWKPETLSTVNRLRRFIGSKSIQRIIGLAGESLDFSKAIDDRAIILVNLKRSRYLNARAARLFAALLLDEFLNIAIQNTHRDRPYWLCADECQNYLTDDASDMLDQAMKSGLRLTLIHHRDSQFADRPQLQGAMDINAGIKCIFHGLPIPECKRHAEEFWFEELNQRWEKERFYSHQTTGHKEVSFVNETSSATDSNALTKSHAQTASGTETQSGGTQFSETDSDSHHEGIDGMTFGSAQGQTDVEGWSKGQGWADQKGASRQKGKSVTAGTIRGTRPEAVIERLTSGVQDFSLEEKLSMLAERFRKLAPREYIVSLPDGPHKQTVPTLVDRLLSSDLTLKFEQTLRAQAIPAAEADQRILDQKIKFLDGDDHDAPKNRTGKPNKPRSPRPLSAQK